MTPFFESPRFVVRELRADEIPALQALFDANPAYFHLVGGQGPRTDEARQAFDERPPPHLPSGQRWFAGVVDRGGALRGLVVVVADLCAPGVWHTALFFLEDALRGTGAAMELHEALEARARAAGARWLRLAVVAGNARAERFWARCGYREVRTRPLVDVSGHARTSRVMVKPLAPGALEAYLRLVPRDAPGSTLP